RARGTVRLHSADPAERPLIELPDRSDFFDVERLVEGYRQALAVAWRREIRYLCSAPPSPDAHEDNELAKLIRRDGYHLPHAVGTCSMGPRPENGAVVDTVGQVHGTERLSVIDASIVPNGPSAFTHLPTIMLATRLSQQLAARRSPS
ncbi:MAG TPA: GMC family oxidoreductase, partial [Leifsonia sp.]